MGEKTIKRINSIDILRMIAAFAVVLIHGYGENAYVNAVSRFSVPLFFMISGYFYCVSKEKKKCRIKKIFVLTVIVNIAILCFAFFTNFRNEKAVSFLTETFTLENFVKLVFFNQSTYGDLGGHLWFLSALLYCMIVDYFVSGFFNKRRKCLVAVIIVLFLGYFIVEKVGNSNIYMRNFLFFGLPYFWIGKIFKDIDITKIKIKNFSLVLFIILFSVLILAEKYMLITYFNLNSARDQYMCTLFLSLSIFTLALKNPLENPGKILDFIASAGRKCSLGIYIIHPIVLAYIVPAAAVFGITLKNPLCVIAAFAASWLIVAIYYFVKEKVWLFYKTKRSKDFVS